MTALRLRTEDLRCLPTGDGRILFHVPSTSLFQLDAVGAALLDAFSANGEQAAGQLVESLRGRFSPSEVEEALADLAALDVLVPAGEARGPQPRPPVPPDALTTLVLNVTTGCNLACTYCYKEDLVRPADASFLSVEDGRRAIDLLVAESGARDRINITFFGGEPLTAMPLIGELVAYADSRGAAAGKRVDYSLTTNGLLLDDHVIDFLADHRFGITVSIDGPLAVHDRNRRTPGGQGSYEIVAAKARRLLERFKGRPIGARVTITSGVTDVVAIHRHLKEELGFAEVGFAPVTAGMPAAHCLDDNETRAVFAGFEDLARAWRDGVLAGRDIGFSNIRQLISVLHEGTSKLIPCGAGVSLLAVEAGGRISLCHRFAGSGTAVFGHVATGIDREGIETFLDGAVKRSADYCSNCHARSICAGGCYHEAQARHGDLAQPTHHYCDLMRRWVDLGISIYAEIMAKNPSFMAQRMEPRRSMT